MESETSSAIQSIQFTNSTEQGLLFLMVFVLMLSVGTSLSLHEFVKQLKTPKNFVLGLIFQYLSMPLLGLFISKSFNFSSYQSLALLLVTLSPGGTTSNLFTFFSKGRVELSVSMTFLHSILAIFLIPILLPLFSPSVGTTIQIPLKNIGITLLMGIAPLFVGVYLKMRNEKIGRMIERYSQKGGNFLIGALVILWAPKMAQVLTSNDWVIFLAIGLTPFLGILIPFSILSLFKSPKDLSKTIGLETGIQNAPLTFAIITLSFPVQVANEMSWIPLFYGATSFGAGFLFCLFSTNIKWPLKGKVEHAEV
jgi:predicted Na+-dependent transporter